MPYNILGNKIQGNIFGEGPSKPKRKTLSSGDRIYIWERPKKYGRTCSICHEKITKLSDLELDHTRAYSKGGTKLALAHKDCNRRKLSGSLRRMQKRLGISGTKRKARKKRPKRRNYMTNILGQRVRVPKYF
jgi:hypothetical protein